MKKKRTRRFTNKAKINKLVVKINKKKKKIVKRCLK